MTSALHQLADRFGIATEFWDWQGRHQQVSDHTIVAVLAAVGVDAQDPDRALQFREDEVWRATVPDFTVLRAGAPRTVQVHVPAGSSVHVWLELEDDPHGIDLRQVDDFTPPREVDGVLRGRASFELPAGLPLGYHRLHAESGGTTAEGAVVVTPDRAPLPRRLGDRRAWGIATQLYSAPSRQSWGLGDLADLTDLAVWGGGHGAGFVLINPLHAAEPTAPMEPSPYLPTSRRFVNPIYLRPERIPEFSALPAPARAVVDDLAAATRTGDHALDRNLVWQNKSRALSLIFAVPRGVGREIAFRNWVRRQGSGLQDWATWCVLAVQHGTRWSSWPSQLQDPTSTAVQQFRAEHAADIDFHCWLQWVCDEQAADTQAQALRAGMRLGVMTDLAVGVNPDGADTWSLQQVYAAGVSVGAPPDAYNQQGQNWTQRPWRPDRLAAVAYAPFRDTVRAALRNAGGLRVDHILGLFRLWWIPDGHGPTDGTYIRYDHEAMIGILALEAVRADAVVVGEDLGTVEPWVRRYLAERGILGTSILWFEYEFEGDGRPLRPEYWRRECLASVTTHDLPPTAGYLAGDHVRLRDRLGLLTRDLDEELAADIAERQAWLDELSDRGALPDPSLPDATENIVHALHRYLTWTTSRLVAVALPDLVGDRNAQNQPGTVDEYPNWRVPLAGPDGAPLLLDDVLSSERAAALIDVVSGLR